MNSFSQTIITWYAEHKRDLPWREINDPYLIWISEIILQQTKVAQGYNYYQRFITHFPTYQALAMAEEEEVLKLWQGLGYYSRARNLHAAAKSIKEKFPTTYQELLRLKGVGEYTAAAISSFAYNEPHAVVDGNVYRVLSRYFGLSDPIDSTKGKKRFKELAYTLLDVENPGLHNQSIMEFGALQCTPKAPRCEECPLADSCLALAQNLVTLLPIKEKKTKTRNRYLHYFYVVSGNAIYLQQRKEKDIWQGLFEFPLIETDKKSNLHQLLTAPLLTKELADVKEPQLRIVVEDFKHVLSHQIIYASLYELILPANTEAFSTYLRVNKNEATKYPFSRLVEILWNKV
ncbi:MAG: A/G-specific adenine glycosylase [Bacteroidaceae bacterium]|nr:A/G-specific adenine glycosylase [Bacteroidaceae bacterium]